MTMKVYECKNTACTLGTPATPGRFSDGATKQQITNLTGNPEPEEYGEGVCPNCGKPGVEVSGVPALAEGTDPYAKHHKAVQAAVLDEDNKSVTVDNAQETFEELVGAKAVREEDDNAE